MNNQYWNSLAKNFEDHVLEISAQDKHGVLKSEIAKAAKGARTVADLGCGTGSLLPLLGPKFKIVYAVDYAAELLEKAKERYQLSNVRYIRHNLASGKLLSFTADVTFCINAIITPKAELRQKLARCVWRTTKSKGLSIFVVPAFESILNTYHTMVRCQVRQGTGRTQAIRKMEKLYRKEVKDPVEGIVDIGKTSTKCFTREELGTFLTDIGYNVLRIRRVEYPWEEELDNVPKWLKDPYPWDWLVVARKGK